MYTLINMALGRTAEGALVAAKSWILIALLSLAGCAALTTPLESPYVSLAGLQLSEVSLFEQRYTLTLRIQNPNAVDLPIAGMNYVLHVNGEEFARGVNAEAVDVPAHGEALAKVDVTSNLAGLFDQIKRLGSGGEPRLDYKLEGSVSLASRLVKLPFKYEGSVDMRP